MDPEQLDRVESLFAHARRLAVEDRAAYLDRSCDDPAVRVEVESLLKNVDPEFLETRSHLPDRATRGLEDEPQTIGHFRILEVLGSGGMGVVYLAQQEQPVRRRVAVKLIKLGMDTRQIVARFEGERQALALMNHPAIARVFEAGATENGRPYFVMEHVPGVPITEHCDSHRLDTRQRLELFVQVCEGVQHAHQKGVIHRDIKASNVLVAFQDGVAVPKIIDFGVAKAIDHRLTEATLHTAREQIVGTPEYMSPEQADLTVQDIDTRTDVYSLGVLLYELLVGTLPIDSRDLRAAGFDELRRRIREDDPPTPSTRFSRMTGTNNEISQKRRSDPSTYARLLRGDLDWITMRSLEKDRSRRYNSASELAADIQRYLEDEPVLARPPSTAYRLRKFARRHRVGVVAAAVVAFALVLGMTGTTIGLLRAREAERAARQAEAQALEESDRANREADAAKAVSDYMAGVFELSAPDRRRVGEITARELLDSGAGSALEELADQPEVRARFLYAIGKAYRGLGLYEEAHAMLRESLTLRQTESSLDPEATYDTMNELGNVAMQTGRHREARQLYEAALPIAEHLLGPEAPGVATVLKNLGDACALLGDPDTARKHQERALAIREAAFGPENSAVAASLASIANLHLEAGDYEAAIPILKRSLAVRVARWGPDHRRTALGHYFLGNAQFRAGRFTDAVEQLQSALAILDAQLDPTHSHVIESASLLAHARLSAGDADGARPVYARVLEVVGGGGHGSGDVADSLTAWAAHLAGVGSDDAGRAAAVERSLRARLDN